MIGIALSVALVVWGQSTPETQTVKDGVLRGLKTINFAHPIPNNTWVHRLVTAEEINTLALQIFRRYKIPIQETPLQPVKIGDSIGYKLPPGPVLDFSVTTHTTQCGPNCVVNTGDIRLELKDEVQLPRNPTLTPKLTVTIWETSVDPVDDRQALLDAFTSMVERFCLSYLSANR